jgi:hypothetical protein
VYFTLFCFLFLSQVIVQYLCIYTFLHSSIDWATGPGKLILNVNKLDWTEPYHQYFQKPMTSLNNFFVNSCNIIITVFRDLLIISLICDCFLLFLYFYWVPFLMSTLFSLGGLPTHPQNPHSWRTSLPLLVWPLPLPLPEHITLRRRPSNNTRLWRQTPEMCAYIKPNEQRLQPQNIYGQSKNYGF